MYLEVSHPYFIGIYPDLHLLYIKSVIEMHL